MRSLAALFLALALSGCALNPDERIDLELHEVYTGFSLYYGDFSSVRNMSDIPDFMYQRVKYSDTDDPQSPEYTLSRGKGDCDCYAMLYMNIAFVRFGVKCDLAFCDASRQIIEGGKINHAVVRLPSGEYIGAQSGLPYTGPIGYVLDFDEVFSE
jgi:hypothetical protein